MVDNVDYDLSLIAEVEENPILYDASHVDFKCSDLRHDVWKEITYRLKQTCDEESVRLVKNRWKSMRDALVKETRYQQQLLTSGTKQKPRRLWRYSNAMAFLIPHLAGPNPAKGNRRKKKNSKVGFSKPTNMDLTTQDDNQMNEMNQNGVTSSAPQVDKIDIFFKDIAETVKKLSPENQMKVQKDIVNIVLDSKLWEIQDTKDPLEDSCSDS